MPNIKSAKKRVKVIATKTLRNKMLKSQLNTAVKKFKAAVEAGDKEAAQVAYVAAVKKVDQAVAKGILHKNNAAHKKSQFTLKLNAMALGFFLRRRHKKRPAGNPVGRERFGDSYLVMAMMYLPSLSASLRVRV